MMAARKRSMVGRGTNLWQNSFARHFLKEEMSDSFCELPMATVGGNVRVLMAKNRRLKS
tara:strand:- start:341 stop:517 length:177 start_codon:yes stop_codon:yes gene_type:complete